MAVVMDSPRASCSRYRIPEIRRLVPIVRKMNVTREMEGILDLFDRPRTMEEVLQISALGNFDTARFIWTFLILGIIEEILVAPQWSHDQEEPVAQVPERTILPIKPAT